jgi:hypothetical protein
MKKIILLLIITLSLSSCAQNLKCADFKDGEFIIESSVRDNRIIKVTRNGNNQIEFVNGETTRYEIIEWIDDCSYKLIYDKSKMDLNDIQKYTNLNGGVIVTKLKIEGDCLYYKATFQFEGEVQRLDGKICAQKY